jgi:hypothetical protein
LQVAAVDILDEYAQDLVKEAASITGCGTVDEIPTAIVVAMTDIEDLGTFVKEESEFCGPIFPPPHQYVRPGFPPRDTSVAALPQDMDVFPTSMMVDVHDQ